MREAGGKVTKRTGEKRMSRQNDEARAGARGKAKRGSVNNKKRLEAFAKAKGDTFAEWDGADAELLQGVINKITALGGAITIGLSRDNGAYMMTLLLDGERETLWFNGNADLDEELRLVLGMLDAMD